MPTVQERYAAATAYVRRAIAAVEDRGLAYVIDPITGLVEWYAGKTKTAEPRNELAHIEARWLRATTDNDRGTIARDAELLADRVEESLPGAPQDRARTNLYKGETPHGTPETSYEQEVDNQAGEVWGWIKDKANGAEHAAWSIGKWVLVGGGVVAAWKGLDYLRERERRLETRAASTERRSLNASLAGVANVRGARPRSVRSKPLRLSLDDTELETWFERDRAHVELRDRSTGQTIVEWWDEDVQQAIEDGFLPHQWKEAKAHAAAFEYAKSIGLVEEGRNTSGERHPPHTYSIHLKRGEIEALQFLRGRYASAKAFIDGLVPLDDDADQALSREFVRGQGPYRFQIRATDVRKALRATVDDGGDYGAIPNLRSDTVDWVLAEEWRPTP